MTDALAVAVLTFVLLEKIARFRRVYVRGAAEYRTQGGEE